jgi:hypothetical protein
MKAHYVLVDFENVQPRNLGLLRGGGFRIKVFLGSQQGKLDVDFVRALQAFGEDAEYIPMGGSGKNALDFHLAYFLGKLSTEHPGAAFSIISRDTGFDPLVRYLKAQGIDCKRSAAVMDIPHLKSAAPAPAAAVPTPAAPARKPAKVAKAAPPAAPVPAPAAARPARKAAAKPKAPAIDAARLELVLQNLRKRDKGLPKTLRTLRSTVASLLVKPPAKDGEADALLEAMQQRGLIAVDGNRVAYSLG